MGQARISVRRHGGRRKEVYLGESRRVPLLDAHGSTYPVKADGQPACDLTVPSPRCS
jgi:hypothetical protein